MPSLDLSYSHFPVQSTREIRSLVSSFSHIICLMLAKVLLGSHCAQFSSDLTSQIPGQSVSLKVSGLAGRGRESWGVGELVHTA